MSKSSNINKKVNVNKKNLLNVICDSNSGIAQVQLDKAVNTVFEEISTALVCGDRVEIRGFGSFVVKKRAQGKVRNPKSGEEIQAKPRGSLYFRASKELTKALNFKGVNDNKN